MNLEAQILKGLQERFKFRKPKGNWMQEGLCPNCKQWEAFCSASEPKIVRCSREERCGWEDSVRNLLPDLFEDWSKRFPTTDANPTAAADAYLLHERGFDLQYLRGAYSQEVYHDPESDQSGATVRFQVGPTWWERIIDRPGRFGKKAHFKKGGKPGGHAWMPSKLKITDFAQADRIFITEGIFNAQALYQGAGLLSVSAMSCNYWPEHFLDQLKEEIRAIKRPTRPELVFAFDPGAAGVKWTRKFVDRAIEEGWAATAAQVRPDGEGTTHDWNDLFLRHQQWKGKPEHAPLSPEMIEEYLWNGAVTIAKKPREKAHLIFGRKALASFDFRHGNRLWWCRSSWKDETHELIVEEIANCAFRMLYRERDEISDETNYFLQVDFPDQPTVKARFTAACCANSGEFKKRLMAFAGMWSGSGEQLDRLMRNQTRRLKVVEPIPFTGYSAQHRAWLFPDIAVRDGRIEKINGENYFDFGQQAVKLRSPERLLDIQYDPDRMDFEWVPDLWTAFGPKGVITLAFFVMSFFAVQIRDRHKTLGFLELTGPPGSGKSTLIELMWKMAGRAGYEGFDPNKGTPAFIARSLLKVSNLPVGFMESGRDDDKRAGTRQFDPNELLVLYGGRSPRGLGQKSGGYETSEPPFLGAIYLMQNERIDAHPAVLERLMSMPIDKSRWSEATRDAAVRLETWPMENVSGTIVHVVRNEAKFLPFFFERYTAHDREMSKRVPGLVNSRPIKTHSQLAAAVEALPHLFPNIRPEWIAETLQQIDAMALDRQQSCGGDHPLVSRFWEQVEFLLDREKTADHEEGKSLNQHRDLNKIAIRLVEFEARCRNAGIVPPDMDKLKKLLRGSKSRKWLATKNVRNPADHIVLCWIFENPQSPENIL
ncbi:bifunctional DNA primase/helicase [Sphingobium sp.]|uniref:bifunctional DNA primase/helicase n=1 Tax=Sphingobium sp. TaxID=1912891 RepID=UPI0028BD7A5B|nr:bifunctional DNA primase/helicase [Sphingobium sp.]